MIFYEIVDHCEDGAALATRGTDVEGFKRVLKNYDITEADYFTANVIEDTCVDMEISLARYGYGPKLAKVKNVCGMKMVSQ